MTTIAQAIAEEYVDLADGIDHINIWIDGNTELGRKLSHFHVAPFTHPVYGPFKTMEGFWHWIKTRERPDRLRVLPGIKCKLLGKTLTKKHCRGFRQLIRDANYQKITQNPDIRELITKSTLPFEYYYIFGPDHIKIKLMGDLWIIQMFEELRKTLQAEYS